MFDAVDPSVDLPELDLEILEFWRQADIAKRSFEKDGGAGHYTFYEGPPTANGKPGLHHASTRSFKDLVLRYKTMRGYKVGRRGGWDTHGLPVEVEIEKQIGSTGKKDIEAFGIAEFNERCRDSVFRYIKDWNDLTERIGFWLDLDNAYITYENGFIESCWWILKELWDRGLLFEDYKITMHCPRCNTSLADHEAAQGMKPDAEDPSVWVKFPAHRDALVEKGWLPADDARTASFLIWTTTPWTLPANSGIAIKPEGTYALVEGAPAYGRDGDPELYIVGEKLLDAVFGDDNHRVLTTIAGTELVGLRYDPIIKGRVPAGTELAKAHRVVPEASVELEEGTGLVHIAPAYGDLEIGRKNDVPTLFSVDLDGTIFPEVELPGDDAPSIVGVFFKDADKPIMKALARAGFLFRRSTIVHAYPFCWRDGAPLLYYAKRSWYIRTTAVKDKLLSNNADINWVPQHIQTGRFGNWLENNIDWAISRERYWGTPLPIWSNEDDSKRHCIGSVEELSKLTGRDLSELDLHRPYIDEITFEIDGETYRRVPYTIDVWFESGAMPYAQWHYPFENQEEFESAFPADYICEAMDQTRGWFYSLHAIATLLTDPGDGDRAPGPLADLTAPVSSFRNCMVLGFINDAQGRKMSKSRGNTVDPWEVVGKSGADALRWYLFVSGSPDQNKSFDPAGVHEGLRAYFLTLWNLYSFFVSYARLDGPDLSRDVPFEERPFIDRWILSRLQTVIAETTERLDTFQVAPAARGLADLVVNDLSRWYVRRSRRRFWKADDDGDKLSAYLTLYEALVTVTKLSAPFAPFVSEAIYQNLVRKVDGGAAESVHLDAWPEPDTSAIDARALADMDIVTRVVALGRTARSQSNIKTRQPLEEIAVYVLTDAEREGLERHKALVLEELNVKNLRFVTDRGELSSVTVDVNWRVAGPLLRDKTGAVRKLLQTAPPADLADRVQAGEGIALDLGGQTLELPADVFVLKAVGVEDRETAEEHDTVVALSTVLSEALILEGRARDIVRVIQTSRKNAGLELSDRIHVGLEVPAALQAAVDAHRAYIQEETLADSLALDALDGESHTETFKVEGEAVTVSLREKSS